MTAGAELFELEHFEVAPGRSANVALIDLDTEWVAGEQGWESRAENCCFGGRRLRGRVLLTLSGGGVAYRERALEPMAAA